jgi:predicted permease
MLRNVKHAVRGLSKSPFVAAIAVVSLALGIGANAAIFSLFHQMLLRSLPVDDPGRLVNLSAPGVKSGSNSCNTAGDCDAVFSYPMFRDLAEVQTVFTGIAAHRAFDANLAYGGETSTAGGMMVSGSYFPVLGLRAAIGRLIGLNDDATVGESAVVVLSHSYWQTRFAGDPSILNDTLVVNGQPMSIIGVAPEGFDGTTLGLLPKVFVPITMRGVLDPRNAGHFENRLGYWMYLFARLNPGIDIEGARAAVGAQYSAIINEVEAPLQTGMSEPTLEQFRARQMGIEEGSRGQSGLHADAAAPLTLLNGVTGLVLLIACANIANLLLGRAVARSGEMAVRLSLGAERRQLIGQLLTESLVLAAIGGAAGLLVARWTLSMITTLLPAQAAAMIDLQLNGPVLAFTAATAIGAGLLFGLFPALVSTRSDVLSALKGQAGQPAGARSASRFRAVLTTGQIALSMALLVTAGLFIRSLAAVSRIDLGLDVNDVVTFRISPERNGYEPATSRDLFERTEEALAALPGVSRVTAAMIPLLAGSSSRTNVRVEGFDGGPDADTTSSYNLIGPDYFGTLGITMLAGREFTRSDVLGAPKVAIVNEEFARKFGLGRDAVGRRMRAGGGDELDIEIIGLVENAKYNDVKDEIPPQHYLPYRQSEGIGSITFYARSELDARRQLSAIAPLLARLDANLPVEHLRTMQMQIEDNTFGDRVVGVLSAGFATLATLLAAVGLYGVLAYTVAQRTREIGLRVALGAAPARVRGLILRQMIVMTVIGGLIGLAAALALGYAAESLLFEINGHDPVALVAAAILLGLIALAAASIPAHRATRVDPMTALRAE